jgi:hypothetical protein
MSIDTSLMAKILLEDECVNLRKSIQIIETQMPDHSGIQEISKNMHLAILNLKEIIDKEF